MPSETLNVNVPEVFTTILWVVAPLLQMLPEAALEVSVTLPPWQNVVGPFAVIVGIGKVQVTNFTTFTLLLFT
jgi:hypothetical protein